MDKIKNYFNILQKHFGTNEVLQFELSSTKLIIKPMVLYSVLLKHMENNKITIDNNLKQMIKYIYPGVNPNKIIVEYFDTAISIDFYINVNLWFDLLPIEMNACIFSHLDAADLDKIGRLNDRIDNFLDNNRFWANMISSRFNKYKINQFDRNTFYTLLKFESFDRYVNSITNSNKHVITRKWWKDFINMYPVITNHLFNLGFLDKYQDAIYLLAKDNNLEAIEKSIKWLDTTKGNYIPYLESISEDLSRSYDYLFYHMRHIADKSFAQMVDEYFRDSIQAYENMIIYLRSKGEK